MKIGLVGYQGSGKSTLFEWLTGVAADPALAHKGQSAMAPIPDPRIEALCQVYHPKKVTTASLELVDTPGLSRTHEGNPARLAMIREAGCLVLVVGAHGGSDGAADLAGFFEDLLLADMEILSGRIERITDSLRKPRPRPEREQLHAESEAVASVLAAMEAGRPLRTGDMTDEQLRATRSFALVTEKPMLAIINTADDEDDAGRFAALASEDVEVVPIPLGLELELSKMTPEDRAEFEEEMGVGGSDRDQLLRTILKVSGSMIYFTAGETEVRTWLLRQGGTALDAAAEVHTDLARGFIRAEVMTCSDLARLGSEREVKAQHLMRQEFKDYVVRDDDVLFIRSGI